MPTLIEPARTNNRTMPEEDRSVLRDLVFYCFERNFPIVPTGSQVIGGATEQSDWDYVVYATHSKRDFIFYMVAVGFTQGEQNSNRAATQGGGQVSSSYRLGNLNVLVVGDAKSFNLWHRATEIARTLKPATKQERVAIFDCVFEKVSQFAALAAADAIEEDEEESSY